MVSEYTSLSPKLMYTKSTSAGSKYRFGVPFKVLTNQVGLYLYIRAGATRTTAMPMAASLFEHDLKKLVSLNTFMTATKDMIAFNIYYYYPTSSKCSISPLTENFVHNFHQTSFKSDTLLEVAVMPMYVCMY